MQYFYAICQRKIWPKKINKNIEFKQFQFTQKYIKINLILG